MSVSSEFWFGGEAAITELDAVDFDHSGDKYSGGNSGVTQASQATLSFWFRVDGSTSVNKGVLYQGASNGGTNLIPSNKWEWFFGAVTGHSRGRIYSNRTFTAGSGVHHFLASYNYSGTLLRLYIDDVDDLSSSSYINGSDIAANCSQVGAGHSTAAVWDGALSEFWWDDGYIDISVTANRRKFITSAVGPVDLGSTGQDPTGSSPRVYLKGNTSTFHTNLGTGGNYTKQGNPTNTTFTF